MSDYSLHVEAAMVSCPRCGSGVGAPCWTWTCHHRPGRAACGYKVCARKMELDTPHVERGVKARQEIVAERVARAKAEALREAADDMPLRRGAYRMEEAIDWLHERADRWVNVNALRPALGDADTLDERCPVSDAALGRCMLDAHDGDIHAWEGVAGPPGPPQRWQSSERADRIEGATDE